MILTFVFSFMSLSFGGGSTPGALTVGSYNIHHQAELVGLGLDFSELRHIDVLALQEVEIQSGPVAVLPQAPFFAFQKAWPFHCIERVNQNSDGSWESLVILSRLPLLKCGALPLEHSGDKKRVALWASIETPGGRPLLMINTDHEISSFLTLGFPDRKKQLQSLIHHLHSCTEWLAADCAQWPTVVGGDFNTLEISITSPFATANEIEETILFLKEAHLKHVQPCLGDQATIKTFWGSYQLDHLFVKNLESSCRHALQNRLGSDHLPIWSLLTL